MSWIKRTLQVKKAGHTGTLDPGVPGVLPVCLGRATKAAQWLSERDKSYRAEVTLGRSTDTQDSFGTTVSETDASGISFEDIMQVFSTFKGDIKQIPPMVSAVKHQGKRLYQLARQGIEVDRPARLVTIYSTKIVKISDLGTPTPKLLFDITCSKGTYIRTICADVGQGLGTGGVLSYLIRTAAGPFVLENAWTIEDIQAKAAVGRQEELITPLPEVLSHLPAVVVRPGVDTRVQNGNAVYQPGVMKYSDCEFTRGGLVRLNDQNGKLLAVARVLDNPLKPEEVCFQPETVF